MERKCKICGEVKEVDGFRSGFICRDCEMERNEVARRLKRDPTRRGRTCRDCRNWCDCKIKGIGTLETNFAIFCRNWQLSK